MEKQLFVAEILRELLIAGKQRYYELAMVMIKTRSLAEAEKLAYDYGSTQNRSYPNVQGEQVDWRFVKVFSVNPAMSEVIGEITEISCQLFDNEAALPVQIFK
jgi:hypothetical protein